jgi:hypothetical protein
MDSSFLISSLEAFAGLAMIGFVYVLMVAFDVEESLLGAIPFFSLSLCIIGFALMSFLFVLEPSWLGVNPLSWIWIIAFMIIWAMGSSWPGLNLVAVFCYFLLPKSQRSTDTRPHWQRMLTDPSSPAITTISWIALLLIAIGFRAGSYMNKSFDSPLKELYSFGLLLSSAVIGLCLGEVVHVVMQVVKIIAT